MSTELGNKAFWDEKNSSFVPATTECDLLHPQFRASNPSPALSETQYFGFSVPEHGIHAMAYLWHHPNIGVATGGAWAWQGRKTDVLQSELFGWTAFADDGMLDRDLWDYTFDNGYHVQTIEPLKRHRLRYDDPVRGNAFDIHTEALMEPMVLETGLHFEQAVRAHGTLTLRGQSYPVDCTNVRDRSWGQARREAHAPTPPVDWMTGVFGDDLMFGATAFDDPDLDPDWKAHFTVPGGEATKGGWVLRDGRLIPVAQVRKVTQRDPATLMPISSEASITDAEGSTYEIRGHIIAANRISAWPTMNTWVCLTRWECEGRVCYGDLQEVQWHDFTRQLLGPQ